MQWQCFFYKIKSYTNSLPACVQIQAYEIDPPDEMDVDESDCQQNDRIHPFEVVVGDSVKISCRIKNTNKCTTWTRQDGSNLPSNSILSGGKLVPIQQIIFFRIKQIRFD